ncbi:hypothetical protein JYU34_002213 [Plutella xylostella]|uniref:Uncharacterized protein n=1 Tax=Plutella xylostella TaxID=51655 RepID=A0ABQ7R1Q0_PLUXY|nr:hypothetical protein JYU34_007095 [Plutella xylostella]KAG7311201.1 hypothetical protein JYU34_002213 [Plutella xylostella]
MKKRTSSKPTLSSPDPVAAINKLEAKLSQGLATFDARLAAANTSTPTLEQLAADFRTFKECILQTLNLLKTQIAAVTQVSDDLDNQGRRKFLLFRGVCESTDEDVSKVVSSMCVQKLGLSDFTASDIKKCFRLNSASSASKTDRPRPILVRFRDASTRAQVWGKKKSLKATPVSICEFLTARRRDMFLEARRRFGMKNCWTQDGNVFVKPPDGGNKIRINSRQDLDAIPAPMQAPADMASRPTLDRAAKKNKLVK